MLARAACMLALSACASKVGPPRYRVVHIDTLAPEKATQFEAARRAFVVELRRTGASDLRGRFFQVVGVGFLTLRTLARFGELDERGPAVARAMQGVPAEARERYDRLSDEALVFPHASEVWVVDEDLGYAPAGAALTETSAGAARLVIEETRPDTASEERYGAVWEEIKRALGKTRYPLARIAYRSVYGGGRLVTMWLAGSPGELAAAPTVEAALTGELGAARCAELLAAWDACVLRREMHELVPRPDLSSP